MNDYEKKYNGAGQQNRAQMVIQAPINEAVAIKIIDTIVFIAAIVMPLSV